MKILVNRTALIRAIVNATGLSPLPDEQRKAMFAKSGRGGGGGGGFAPRSAATTSTSVSKAGVSTTKITSPAVPVKPQPQQPIWDAINNKWWFPPSVNDPRPTPKPPYAIPDPTRPIMGIPERPPYGSQPPRYSVPTPTPKPQPKPAPKPVTKPSPTPPIYYAPPRVGLPVQPTDPRLLRPWM